MKPIDATDTALTDTALTCLSIALFFYMPILADTIAAAICKIRIPIHKKG